MKRKENRMQTRKRILIAVDGSRHSLDAVTYVARQCSASSLEARLLFILPTDPEEVFRQIPMNEEFMRQMKERYDQCLMESRKEAERFLEHCRDVLVGAGFSEDRVGLSLCRWKEGIARDIVSEASRGYDGVVVGRRGLGRVESVLLGSVSEKVLQRVHDAPVWIIGGDIGSSKMLLAVDSSDNARKAVQYAAPFLADCGAEVALCHVVRGFLPILGPSPLQPGEELEEQLLEGVKQRVASMFESYRECLEKAGVEARRIVNICRIGSHSRAAEILKVAREEGYGTVIMGRRGISAVREFLMGRVTRKVLSGAESLAVWIVS